MTDVNNCDDLIDSRDVIARIEELEGERESAIVQTACIHCKLDIEGSEGDLYWHDRGNNCTCPLAPGSDQLIAHEPPEDTRGELPEDEATELATLKALQEEAEGYSNGDWKHGATLIRESYFERYAQDLADDLHGSAVRDASWPFDCIDWEKAADALRMDYTSADFDGVTYLIR